MTTVFQAWQRDFHTLHLTLYYDMTLGRFMYVNGSACREPLPVDLRDFPIPLDSAGLGCRTEAIEDKLRLFGNTPR
jgi:hypothetical protein